MNMDQTASGVFVEPHTNIKTYQYPFLNNSLTSMTDLKYLYMRTCEK